MIGRKFADREIQVVIAEDDEDDVVLLKRALRNIVVEDLVQICRNGQEVLDYLQGNGIRIIPRGFKLRGGTALRVSSPAVN